MLRYACLLGLVLVAANVRLAVAQCINPDFHVPTITQPQNGAVLNEISVVVTWTLVPGGLNYLARIDGGAWERTSGDFIVFYNLAQGGHTVDVLVGCTNAQGGMSDGGIATVSFTLDVFATSSTLSGGSTSSSTSTTSTTLPAPPPPAPGSASLDSARAPAKRVSVSVLGTLTLPGGVDASLACTGVLDGLATYKKLAPVPGAGTISALDGACAFGVLFDLPKKVVTHKVRFDFAFGGNAQLGPLDFARTLKVKKPKKPNQP